MTDLTSESRSAPGVEDPGAAVLAAVEALGPVELAYAANVQPPMDDECAGARWLVAIHGQFLAAVRGYLNDETPVALAARRWQLDHGPATLADAAGIDDDAEVWRVLVDLGLLNAPPYPTKRDRNSDLTSPARGTLYLAAGTLAEALGGMLTGQRPVDPDPWDDPTEA